MKVRKLNKKGSLTDILWVGIVLFVIAVTTLIVFKVSDEFNTQIQANDDIPSNGKEAMNTMNGMYPGIIDNSFLFLMITLSIGAIITAFMVRVHPVFVIFFMLLLAVIIFISAAFSNVYEEMASQTSMVAVSSQLTSINFVMQYLPLFIGVFGSIIAIVMYKGYKDNAF